MVSGFRVTASAIVRYSTTNATLGNLTELVIALTASRAGEYMLVKASTGVMVLLVYLIFAMTLHLLPPQVQ
jgi:hypothetical protein